MFARLANRETAEEARRILSVTGVFAASSTERTVHYLLNGGIDLGQLEQGQTAPLTLLARNSLLEFFVEGAPEAVRLIPCRWDFSFELAGTIRDGNYKMARLAYIHSHGGAIVARHPDADCYLRIEDSRAVGLLAGFKECRSIHTLICNDLCNDSGLQVLELFARAGILQLCDEHGRTLDDTCPKRRQWEFHDAVFHSRSRLGRTNAPVGATWSFRGDIPQQPAIKQHPWTATKVPLPRPDLGALMLTDMPLTRAIEARKSVRHNGIIPLCAAELGEFLYRTVRVRDEGKTADGDFVRRPYPSGGALYENEIYVSIDRCLDVPRGFYYYDPVGHALCLISPPDWNLEALLEEARMATAGICRPQILLTISSRHTRFNWKYSGMAYAAQLKHVGVIYQTMYLVATAMGIGACALGLGNTDRFLAMTGLDWFEEGSVGEFLIGRPL